jgi:hypothetical protein
MLSTNDSQARDFRDKKEEQFCSLYFERTDDTLGGNKIILHI